MYCTPAVTSFWVKGAGNRPTGWVWNINEKGIHLAKGDDGVTGNLNGRALIMNNDKLSNPNAGFLAAPVGLLRNPPLDGYLSRPRGLVL